MDTVLDNEPKTEHEEMLLTDAEEYHFPLSLAQQRLWILSQFEGTGEAYAMPGAYNISGHLDLQLLQESLNYLVRRHEALHTRFICVESEPMQVITTAAALPLEVLDLSGEPDDDKRTLLDNQYCTLANHTFDLEVSPLIKIKLIILGKDQSVLLFSMHHIISDALSIRVFLKELGHIYKSLRSNTPIGLVPLPIQYVDFAVWQRNSLETSTHKDQLEFWRDYLKGCNTYLPLPLDYPRPALRSFSGNTYKFHLPNRTVSSLRTLAKQSRATMFITSLALFSLLLSRYSGERDLVIGSPSSGRNRKELESVIGFFINTLVIRLVIEGKEAFPEYLDRVKASVLKAQANQDFPLEKLLDELGIEGSPSHNPLFQVMFSYQTENFDSFDIDNVNLTKIPLDNRTSKFDLTLTLIECDDGLNAEFEYSSELFSGETIKDMAENFIELLTNIVALPSKPVCEYPLLSDRQYRNIVTKRNQTYREYEVGLTIDALVSRQAGVDASACAIEHDGTTISYGELESRSDRFAQYLTGYGIVPGSIVGISIPPSIDMVVGIVGIFKAGAAYLPFDPAFPEARIQYILQNAGAEVVVSNETSPGRFGEVEVLLFSDDKAACESNDVSDLAIARNDDDLAYLIYTSGSTGNPKGVQVEHKSVINFLLSMRESLKFSSEQRVISVTSLSFDISVLEIFLPLTTGATLVIADRAVTYDGEKLSALLETADVTFMQATPSTWRILREVDWKPKRKFTALCGGEAFPEDIAGWLCTTVDAVWNMYGPTETTIWSTLHPIDAQAPTTLIGKPIANTQVYVLDEFLQPVPDGVTGELYISGNGVTRGYIHNPKQTQARYLQNPLGAGEGKMYRTGDLVRYVSGGYLQYLGRSDQQIKHSGYRIELGEIESALRECGGIDQAVVVYHNTGNTTSSIVAYCTPEGSETMPEADVKHALGRVLPGYMIPQKISYLDTPPLTPNGKIDRKALQERWVDESVSHNIYTPPVGFVEQTLATIWQEVLRVEKVGREDSFFQLGGASLQCVMVVNKAAEKGLCLKPEDIFEHETLARVAKKCVVEDDSRQVLGDVDVHHEAKSLEVDFKRLYERDAGQDAIEAHERVAIESIGTYLPKRGVSSKEVVQQCTNPVKFPLQRVTGIKSRCVVAEDEFAIDLSIKAIEEALSHSSYREDQIELLICCNICRHDGDKQVYFEPSTSIRLAKHFGFVNAHAIDISNACTGFFTAVHVAQAFLMCGTVRNALIVSGEHITHLTETAQKELVDYLDPKIACLTLGDAGAAVILEKTESKKFGLCDFEMFTLSEYSDLCIAKKTDQAHGGVIMVTDAIRMVESGYQPSSMHTMDTITKNKWRFEMIDHIIMHQTSEISLKNAKKEVNLMFNEEIINDNNLINNVAERGNTASTTHFVAVMDHIKNGTIKSGSNVVFVISGSGMNFGTALYTFDDLPDRIMRTEPVKKHTYSLERERPVGRTPPTGVVIDGIGLSDEEMLENRSRSDNPRETLELLRESSKRCISEAGCSQSDIDLVMFAGVYRSDFIIEPAIAALLAGDLGINSETYDKQSARTFVYDVLNGSLGFLNACYISLQYMKSGIASNALIATSEIENNRDYTQYDNVGVSEVGSAVMVRNSDRSDCGFGGIGFYNYPEYIDLIESYWTWSKGQHYIHIEKDPRLHSIYIDVMKRSVDKFLTTECIDISEIDWILPPIISDEFHADVVDTLKVESNRVISIPGHDLFTSSIPYAMKKLIQCKPVKSGDIALIISVGSGVQIGLALYYF